MFSTKSNAQANQTTLLDARRRPQSKTPESSTVLDPVQLQPVMIYRGSAAPRIKGPHALALVLS
jgi:hypothetical protein